MRLRAFKLFDLAALAIVVIQAFGFLQSVAAVADSVAQFRLHLSFVLAVFFAVSLLLRRWKLSLLTGLSLVAGISMLSPAFPSLPATPIAGTASLRIVQFNTLFDNQSPALIESIVRSAEADVVTLQEVSNKTAVILDDLSAEYPFQIRCRFTGLGGVAVMARYPVSSKGCVEGEGLAWLLLDLDGRKITVASLHLHWPWPYRQPGQIKRLEPALLALPRPVVLAGDFNAVTWSNAVARVETATGSKVIGGLRLSLMLTGMGTNGIPFLPIDQILMPADWSYRSVRLGPPAGSDHLPVIAKLIIP